MTCDRLVKGRFYNYERVTKAFKKFFCEDEIMQIIDKKAEKANVDPILESKASKDELKTAFDQIENMNNRIKHLSSLQNQLANTLQPVTQNLGSQIDIEHRANFQKSLGRIHKHSTIVNTWVNETNLNETHQSKKE